MKTTVNPKFNLTLLPKHQIDEENLKDLKDSNKTKTTEKNTVGQNEHLYDHQILEEVLLTLRVQLSSLIY